MAKATVAGIASLGVTFGYGVETTKGEKPASFEQLDRINSIGGISIEPEQIDASALEDLTTKNIKGRADTGGSFSITVNATDETIAQWKAVITAYKGLSGGLQMWFETVIPGFTDSFFVIAQPPEQLPQPEIGQNELLTMEIPLTIVDYKGMLPKVALTDNGTGA